MACNWRIRHKLFLGLGLVLAVMALLLTGTLKGLASYRTTMRTFTSRLEEMGGADGVDGVRNAIKVLGERSVTADKQADDLREKIIRAKEALDKYQKKLTETVEHGRDPDNGREERLRIQALEEQFLKLEEAIAQAVAPGVRPPGDPSLDLLGQDAPTKIAIERLIVTSDDLKSVIFDDLYKRIKKARADFKTSLAIVLSTTVVGVLLMLALCRWFYRFVFYPIRDLQRGVGRVAHGDFEHTIDVKSGDEIEDLAEAFNDMTGRLREMYRDLARQVNERSRQLVRSERLAGVGFLAAGVAHEINNPLASIAFCSEALERRLADVLDQLPQSSGHVGEQDREIVNKYLKMIQEEAFRCKEITQRLLEFSRGGERRREPTDLGELIQSVLDMVQHLQNGKGKELTFHQNDQMTAWVNGQEIKSVILNLVVNALDSMDEGGTLTITQRRRDNMAELIFQDTGCGMTGEVLENIFEPFFTRSRTGKGTGLGLSISHRIINQHGGDIEAVSPGPNQGSTFTVHLPLQPVEEQTEPEREPQLRAA
ncbi:MAG TPA: HAMP domain-containing sensor histidine kinase [Gemmataceae bacterium]|nr:HAMP domain-containing sensor histidine kinase [Gemmataceae bacterium]